MTERKPSGVSWQSWVERQIDEARQGGAFDDLDGHGHPIDGISTVHDEMWWIKAKLRDEDIAYLPPTIAIRAEREAAIDAAMAASTEEEVRALLEDLNQHIRHVNSHGAAGPPSSVAPVDVDVIVERWRTNRPPAPLPTVDAEPVLPAPPQSRRWWHRLFGWRSPRM